MKGNTLLFGTMSDIGQTVLEDLLGHGIDAELVEFPQNVYRDFPGYRRELLKAVARLSPTTIIPIGDTLAMAKMREELPAGARVAAGRAPAVELLDSKVRTYEYAEQLGIPQPRRYAPEDAEGILPERGAGAAGAAGGEAAPAPAPARLIYKRDLSFAGSGVHLPKDRASLAHLIAHENGTPYLIEDYIEGRDLSVDCLRLGQYFRAECYLSTARSYTQGPSDARQKIDCPQAVDYSYRILESLDYQGICGFDFRLAGTDSLYLLEANPRFTGGLATQISSGFDIPYLLFTLLP